MLNLRPEPPRRPGRATGPKERGHPGRSAFRGFALSGVCAAILAWAGCVTSDAEKRVSSTGASSGVVEEINLMSSPAALNFDGIPGADGLSLRVYAGNSREAKPVTITSGTLDIMLFDGVVKDTEIEGARPLKVWSYPANRLGMHAQKTSIGVSYVFTPQWGEQKPRQTRVTIVAQLVSPQGRRVQSAPAVVFVTAR